MHFTDYIPESLLKNKLLNLNALYDGVDTAIRQFTETVDFSCSYGCGKCCHGFIPDVLPLEAAYIAGFLISKDGKSAESACRAGLTPLDSLSAGPTCPLYVDGSPFHCSVYEARPLVCRMFGFSGVKDKHGDLSFSLCRFMEGSSPRNTERKFPLMQFDSRFPVKPPVMSRFGEKLQALDPDNSGMRQLLHEAVPPAIGRILFLVSMGQKSAVIESGELV